jgi:RNA polymerase sigma factor (sigma-70 family)
MAAGSLNNILRHLRGALEERVGTADAELLKRYVGHRDEAAFAALVRRHGPMVLGVCRRVLRHEADAEDAFQATFLVLVRKAAALRSPGTLGNWLYGVAYRTALHARHAASKRRAKEAAMPTRSAPPEDCWADLLPVLDQELERLPEKYRAVLVLCELQGKTRREAAGLLGCAEGTVASRRARGLALLAKRLTRHGPAVTAGALATVLSQAVAGVPDSVVSTTIKAAGLLAAGAAVAGAIPVKVAALTEGVMKTMLLSKLSKAMVVLLVTVGVLGGGAGLIYRTQAAGQAETPGTAPTEAPKTPSDGVLLKGGSAFQNPGRDGPAWREMLTMKHEHAVTAVACSADWSAAGDDGGDMFAWDTKTGKNRETLVKGGKDNWLNGVDRLQFTVDGKDLYVIMGGRQAIARYTVKDKKIEGGYGVGGGDFDGVAMGHLGVSADGEIWLEFFREGRAVNLRPNLYTRTISDPNHFEMVEYKAKVSHALVSAGDKWLAVVTKDGTLHIHDRASLQETHTIAGGKEGVVITDVQFSADGQRIAVARDDALAKVYDTAKGEEIATLKGHSGIVFTIAFSPDGKKVVTGGDDNTARVWDAATGKALATLRGHTDSVRCAAFDPSGEILVTGSADKTVKLWRAK